MACESSRNTSTFQSTLSMRRATAYIQCKRTAIAISIHALHEESDPRRRIPLRIVMISIHALHEESDPSCIAGRGYAILFQSTLSMRRATCRIVGSESLEIHLNPRSP